MLIFFWPFKLLVSVLDLKFYENWKTIEMTLNKGLSLGPQFVVITFARRYDPLREPTLSLSYSSMWMST